MKKYDLVQHVEVGRNLVDEAGEAMDEITQQNAARVEQTAAASESLQEQAMRLTELLGTFKLVQGGHMSSKLNPGRRQQPTPPNARSCWLAAGKSDAG